MLATSLSLSGSALSFPYVVHEISDDHEPFEKENVEGERDASQEVDANDVETLMMKCAAFAKSVEIPLLPNEINGTVISFQVRGGTFRQFCPFEKETFLWARMSDCYVRGEILVSSRIILSSISFRIFIYCILYLNSPRVSSR